MLNKVKVGQPGLMLLEPYCRLLTEAFGPCYLVGACLDRRDYRHVDIRLIMDDDKFDSLFGGTWDTGNRSARWLVMCLGITKLLADTSGLPVDFQIQSETWSHTHFRHRERVAIGDV